MAATHDPGATMLQENPGAALRVFQGGAIIRDGIAGITMKNLEGLENILNGYDSIYQLSDEDFNKLFKAIREKLEADREFVEWRARSGVKHTIDSYVDRHTAHRSELVPPRVTPRSFAPPSVASSMPSLENASVASSMPSLESSSVASSMPSLESSSVASSVPPSISTAMANEDNQTVSDNGISVGGNNKTSVKGRRTLKNRRQPPKKARRTLGHASRVSKKL